VSKSIRISGLVRLANQVRQATAHPPSAGQIAQLRQSVESQIAQLGEYLASEGVSEKSLAQPSQRALRFLRSLPWDRIEQSAASEVGGRPGRTLRAPALAAYTKRMQRLLADPSTAGSIEFIRTSLQNNLTQLDGALRTAGGTPAALTKNARLDFGWVSLLASEDYIEKYLSAVTVATPIFERFALVARCRLPIRIHFVPNPGIFRFRSSPLGTVVKLPIGMIAFDAGGFEDIAALSLGHQSSRRQPVIQRMDTEEFQTVRARFDALSGNVGQQRGAFHNLNQSFDRVNARYFDGKMPRPRLTWGSVFTRSKLGHYEGVSDTVQISASLDQGNVPELAMDFLMYHELLHKKHRTEWRSGRGYVHTPAFKEDERRFEGWEQAEKMLEQVARRGAID
jgi:hypothetical protein